MVSPSPEPGLDGVVVHTAPSWRADARSAQQRGEREFHAVLREGGDPDAVLSALSAAIATLTVRSIIIMRWRAMLRSPTFSRVWMVRP